MSLRTGDLVMIDEERADTVALYSGTNQFESVRLPDLKAGDVALVVGLSHDSWVFPLAALLVSRTYVVGWCPGTNALKAVR